MKVRLIQFVGRKRRLKCCKRSAWRFVTQSHWITAIVFLLRVVGHTHNLIVKAIASTVKVLYANQWDDNPRDITKFAPGCEHSSEYCDVTKFIEQSRLLFYDDVQEKCQNSAGNSSSREFFLKIFKSCSRWSPLSWFPQRWIGKHCCFILLWKEHCGRREKHKFLFKINNELWVLNIFNVLAYQPCSVADVVRKSIKLTDASEVFNLLELY